MKIPWRSFFGFSDAGPGETFDHAMGRARHLLEIQNYEDACRILEELKETQDKPGKRSKSFMSEVKALMDYYNETMKLVDKYSDGAGFFFPFYPDQF